MRALVAELKRSMRSGAAAEASDAESGLSQVEPNARAGAVDTSPPRA
jgi:hypothetical protein